MASPYVVDSFDISTKLVHIRYGKDDEIKPFNLAQVRRYYTPEITAFSFLDDVNNRQSYFRNPITEFYATEVINRGDPRAMDPKMTEAVKKEVKGLFERGTFKVILREEVPADANVLPGRFPLAIKSTEDG